MEPEKKISFGFSKISKKTVLLNKPEEKKVELVECLEGQFIKVKDAVEVINEPLVIPIKNTKNVLVDRIKEAQLKEKTTNRAPKIKNERLDSELTIDEIAERELIKDAQTRLTSINSNGSMLVLPMKDKLEIVGENEPTLEDYDKIPIQDFGTAMLRGMGWKEGSGIGKNPARAALLTAPELRPKGLGLGASKLIKTDTSKETLDKEGKLLILKKGTFAKIIAGSYKGQYGEVLGLDDEAARVIVKTAIKRDILTLNEFLVVPVTTEEYNKFSNVLNNAKLEEYKEKEHKMSNSEESKHKSSHAESNFESIDHRNCNAGGSHYEYKRKENLNDSERKNMGTKKEESRNKDYSSDSSSSENEKSSKVHKRKDKRRHRDKSRSPHHRHHRYKGNSKKSSKSKYRSSSSSNSENEKRRDRYKDKKKSSKCKR